MKGNWPHPGFTSGFLPVERRIIAGVLRSRAAGVTSSGVFAAVYGLLYLLVTSEDYALLAGALALFALLATLMVLTRRVDGYGEVGR